MVAQVDYHTWRLAANLKRIGMTVPVREKGFSGWTADALLKVWQCLFEY